MESLEISRIKTHLMLISVFCLFISCDHSLKDILIKEEIVTQVVNGVVLMDNNPLNGTVVSFYSNGNMQSSTTYSGGKKNGIEKTWHSNGTLSTRRFFENGIKVGNHQGWWNDHQLKFNYSFNKQGQYHGKVEEWFSTGQKYKTFHFKNGKENGSQKLWKLDGTIKANFEVINGERFGLIGLKKCYTVTNNSIELE